MGVAEKKLTAGETLVTKESMNLIYHQLRLPSRFLKLKAEGLHLSTCSKSDPQGHFRRACSSKTNRV